MKFNEVMEYIKNVGTAQNRKIYTNHGADLKMDGVSMADLKKLAKKIKTNHELGMQLLHSKHVDAIYLSRWIVDPKKVTIQDLETVLNTTSYYLLIDNVIPYIAANQYDLATTAIQKWLTHQNHIYRQAAYSIYSYLLTEYENTKFNKTEIHQILLHIKKHIHEEENRVRYNMNNFLIAVGVYYPEFTTLAKEIASHIGKVSVSMGNTACKVPDAKTYIEKVEKMNKIGFKRKIT